jgi:hypothetical protein
MLKVLNVIAELVVDVDVEVDVLLELDDLAVEPLEGIIGSLLVRVRKLLNAGDASFMA